MKQRGGELEKNILKSFLLQIICVFVYIKCTKKKLCHFTGFSIKINK